MSKQYVLNSKWGFTEKIRFLGGSTKNQYIRENCLKSKGLGQCAGLKGENGGVGGGGGGAAKKRKALYDKVIKI